MQDKLRYENQWDNIKFNTLLKRNNGEISVLVYRKPTHTDQYLHYSSHHQTSCKESVASSLFNRAYFIITNKDDLHKENARIKQVSCKESVASSLWSLGESQIVRKQSSVLLRWICIFLGFFSFPVQHIYSLSLFKTLIYHSAI